MLGHEGAGVVERVGELVQSVKVGDSVCMSYVACGSCANCVAARSSYCVDHRRANFGGSRIDGSATVTDKDGKAVAAHYFGQSSFATCVERGRERERERGQRVQAQSIEM